MPRTPDVREATVPGSPNILLVITDQQRYDSLESYGFEGGHTPNIDGLAADGALFERCYVNNPICTPSRASLWTGNLLPGHGVYRLYDVLPDDQVLVSEHLRRLGYQTGLIGKLHVSSVHDEAERRHPNDGFDVYEWCVESSIRMDSPFHAYAKWLDQRDPSFAGRLRREGRAVVHHPEELHFNRWASERTLAFIRERDRSRPFFCTMSLFDPHNPYDQFPAGMLERIRPAGIPDPVAPGGVPPPEAVERERHDGYMGDLDRLDRQDLMEMRRGYHASLAFVDQEVGRVLDGLDEDGLREDTLVVFVSDHGDMLGDHRLLVKGAYFYDPGVRVPLIVRWPRAVAGGRRLAGLVQPHDLAATLLEAAGVGPDERRRLTPDALSLVPMAAGSASRVRDHAVCMYRNSGISAGGYWDPPIHATMFRGERYKLSLYEQPSDGTAPLAEGELYDLQDDPHELSNLWSSPSHAAVRQELSERLANWLSAQERRLGSRGGERLPSASQRLDNTLRGPDP